MRIGDFTPEHFQAAHPILNAFEESDAAIRLHCNLMQATNAGQSISSMELEEASKLAYEQSVRLHQLLEEAAGKKAYIGPAEDYCPVYVQRSLGKIDLVDYVIGTMLPPSFDSHKSIGIEYGRLLTRKRALVPVMGSLVTESRIRLAIAD